MSSEQPTGKRKAVDTEDSPPPAKVSRAFTRQAKRESDRNTRREAVLHDPEKLHSDIEKLRLGFHPSVPWRGINALQQPTSLSPNKTININSTVIKTNKDSRTNKACHIKGVKRLSDEECRREIAWREELLALKNSDEAGHRTNN